MTPYLLCFIVGWMIGALLSDWVRYELAIKESESRRLMVYHCAWERPFRRLRFIWLTSRFQWRWPFWRRVPMMYSAKVVVGYDFPFPEYGHFIVFKRTNEKPPGA